jgi:hypothetical protein
MASRRALNPLAVSAYERTVVEWGCRWASTMIRVLILRDRSYTGMLSAVVIEIDGKRAAKVRRGARVEFEIPCGEHVITARMHWLRSDPIAITPEGGDNLRFVCGCRGFGGSMHTWLRIAGYEYHLL